MVLMRMTSTMRRNRTQLKTVGMRMKCLNQVFAVCFHYVCVTYVVGIEEADISRPSTPPLPSCIPSAVVEGPQVTPLNVSEATSIPTPRSGTMNMNVGPSTSGQRVDSQPPLNEQPSTISRSINAFIVKYYVLTVLSTSNAFFSYCREHSPVRRRYPRSGRKSRQPTERYGRRGASRLHHRLEIFRSSFTSVRFEAVEYVDRQSRADDRLGGD